MLIGSLSGKDRLLVNDGTGKLTLIDDVLDGSNTTGTLGLAVADLNGDAKLDVVMAQGELATDERLYWGVDIAPDTAPPIVSLVTAAFEDDEDVGPGVLVRARVHDNKSPTRSHDWQKLVVVSGESETETDLKWYGEYLWRARVPQEAGGAFDYAVCATDAAGNQACSEEHTLVLPEPASEPGPEPVPEAEPEPVEPAPEAEPEPAPDTGPDEDIAQAEPAAETPPTDSDGGCSAALRSPRSDGWLWLIGLVVILCRRKGKNRGLNVA